ncbi:hypothetical protein PPACK8108_LOCUS4585 [Phakopsora pachyrhizi]|uniref:SH3 domain-containing protein n=1 Tax=Phakopsora pachyrhizi TaxID=170000 RepID=A0AAV0AMI0_PHAPC|nr:hypothetical protein PPACK8108_LOCUS4585 [Phakopsora pachyrhizi]
MTMRLNEFDHSKSSLKNILTPSFCLPHPSSFTYPAMKMFNNPNAAPLTPIKPPSSAPAKGPKSSLPRPPTSVIRARDSYRSQRMIELSFKVNDFFHVMGKRRDPDGSEWFEVENPATGARGIVPTDRFEIYGRQDRGPLLPCNPAGEVTCGETLSDPVVKASPDRQNLLHHATRQLLTRRRSSTQGSSIQSEPDHGRRPSTAKDSPSHYPLALAPKCQILNYEEIQGNPGELFEVNCSKTTLCGVVRFQFTAEKPDELTANKGESLIIIAHCNQNWFVVKPIGRLGGPGLIPASYIQAQEMASGKFLSPQKIRSLIQSGVIPDINQWKQATAAYKGSSISLGCFDFPHPQSQFPEKVGIKPKLDILFEHLPRHPNQGRKEQSTPLASPQLSEEYQEFPAEIHLLKRYGTIMSSTVESFHLEMGSFWFNIRVRFCKLDEPNQPSAMVILYRRYEEFVDFDNVLRRTWLSHPYWGKFELPFLECQGGEVDEVLCSHRMDQLRRYLMSLCRTSRKMRESELFYDLLGPREGDLELASGVDFSPSLAGQVEDQTIEYLGRMNCNDEPTAMVDRSFIPRGASIENLDLNIHCPPANFLNTSDSASECSSSTSLHRSYPASNDLDFRGPAKNPSNSPDSGEEFLRIKIFQLCNKDLIALRVPAYITLQDLVNRVENRIGGRGRILQFKSEQGLLIKIKDNNDFEHWMESANKLILYTD